MLVTNSLKVNSSTIYYISDYHKYWLPDGSRNPSFDRNSGLILDLKEMKPAAIDYFYNILNSLIYTHVTLCYVPSSNPTKLNTGIRILTSKLAAQHNRVDGTDCLIRHTQIPSLHGGGSRETSVHFNSVKVENLVLVKNKPIVLLDDVTTSNNSLISHKQLLIDAGASQVECLAIGQTA